MEFFRYSRVEERPMRSLAGLLLLALASPIPQGLPDPAPFDAVLAARARDGGFDYRGVTGQERKRLAAYISNLGDARPAEMTPNERMAFWVNAYNAMALAIVLDRYPVTSIQEISGAFKSLRRKIAGQELSLDDIENRLRETRDPRFHFLIVCASESCPALAPQAYTAETIAAELDRRTIAFINDPSKNSLDRRSGKILLSRIFDWNRMEFERSGGTLLRFIARYAPDPQTAAWLGSAAYKPRFIEYDWRLNQR
jgi:hypothetical protein